MDAWRIRRLGRCLATRDGWKLQRLDPLTLGAVAVLEAGESSCELGFFGASGCTWIWCLEAGDRARLVTEIGTTEPELVAWCPELEWREASPLDALRAWMLRPAPRHPGWSQVEGARLISVDVPHGDRFLDLVLESVDRIGRSRRMTLRFQLFPQAANFALLDAMGGEILNARGKPLATPRAPTAPAGADPHEVAASESRVADAATAHLDIARHAAASLRRARDRELSRQEKHFATLLAKLEQEADEAQAATWWRQTGELLAANLHHIRRGQRHVVVQDLFAGGAGREIELDPDLSPQENVARCFKRARRAERGSETIEARRDDTRQRLQEIQTLRRELEPVETWAVLVRRATETWRRACEASVTSVPLARLWESGGPGWQVAARPTAPDAETGPGRRFVVQDGWEIRVGRSNAENDELTHRFAHPNDIWLHASGVPGSHVVLRMGGRTDNPPREILQIAAAIAARFSKAKHAGTVPVLWTRKRYVRKPRGAKPGLAACTHEKTVFVRPELPGGD